MYVSFNDGASWQALQLNLPVTPITDLAVKRGDLLVATQGRSFWVLDDLTVLHQLADDSSPAVPHLFTPRTVVRWVDGSGGGGRGAVGQNPPFGAVVHYVLPAGLDEEDADEVVLDFLDSDGNVLRSLSSKAPEKRAPSPFRRFFPELAEPPLLDVRAGANRFVWNLALPDAGLVEDAVLWGWPGGPTVPPGSYQVRLKVGEVTETADFDVVQDPRTNIAQAAFDEQYALAREIWQALTRSHATIERIRDVRGQIEAISTRADDEAITAKVDEIAKALTAIEEKLTQVKNESSQDVLNFQPQIDNQLLNLQSVVESALGAPYTSSREVFALLDAQLDGYVAELESVITEQLPDLERLLEESKAPRVVVAR